MSKKKPFYKSWVIMIASTTILIDIVNLLMTTPIIPKEWQGYLSLVSGILVILARYNSNGAQIGKHDK